MVSKSSLENPLNDDMQKEILLKLISDVYARKIIQVTQEKPLSVFEIHQKCGIPKGSVHRRLQNLSSLNFVKVSGTINDNGKKIFLFQSRIKQIKIVFDSCGLNVHLVTNNLL